MDVMANTTSTRDPLLRPTSLLCPARREAQLLTLYVHRLGCCGCHITPRYSTRSNSFKASYKTTALRWSSMLPPAYRYISVIRGTTLRYTLSLHTHNLQAFRSCGPFCIS